MLSVRREELVVLGTKPGLADRDMRLSGSKPFLFQCREEL